MMTVQQAKEKLLQRNLKQVARETGVKYMSIRNFAKGVVENPRADNFQKIVEYLETK